MMKRWIIVVASGLLISNVGFAAAYPLTPPDPEMSVMSSGGIDRSYIVHVPPVLAQPLSLVISLHGGGGKAKGQAELTGYNEVADQHGFLVVYPQGINNNWADGRGATQPDRDRVDDVRFISDLIDKLVGDYGVDASRVFISGMSNGAFMSERLACDLSSKVAAIAAVAGTLGSDISCTPSNPVSIMQVHGTQDPIVPYGGGRMLGRGGFSDIIGAEQTEGLWRKINNCTSVRDGVILDSRQDGTSVAVRSSLGCTANTEVAFYQVSGGGHTWPGGSQYLPKFLIGVTSQEFSASDASWDFFTRHPKPGI